MRVARRKKKKRLANTEGVWDRLQNQLFLQGLRETAKNERLGDGVVSRFVECILVMKECPTKEKCQRRKALFRAKNEQYSEQEHENWMSKKKNRIVREVRMLGQR